MKYQPSRFCVSLKSVIYRAQCAAVSGRESGSGRSESSAGQARKNGNQAALPAAFLSLLPILMILVLPAGLSSCVTQRTVTDSKGNIIYQEPDLTSPFEDTEERLEEVRERERELGW